MNSHDIAQIIATSALDKKATELVIQDLKGLSDICDIQVICSVDNERQAAAVCDWIEERCRKLASIRPIAVEGKQLGNWVLIDFGSVIAHVFLQNVRGFYAIDKLWKTAKAIDLQ